MNFSEDRRITRTKAAIREALVSLIEEKGFEALTVKDIAIKANINRGTFYLHYKDKYDLLDQTLEDIARDIESILLEITNLSVADFINGQTPSAIIIKVFEYFNANASLTQAILATKGNYALQNRIKKIMWHNLFEKNYAPFIKKENLLVPSEYLTSYIASAHFGVVQEWLENGCRETPEEMAKILSNLTFRGPLTAAGIR
ncbi:MAG: TetR/AcrR family transcriptional regulator [Peptococcaceae bacterium]|nr:TetR/AcrR family transcriptional regulator [Peptococcaceae bacterium]